MTPPIRILPLLLALVATLHAAAPARAQDLTGDRVRIAIERTDVRIELARSLVATSGNADARIELDAATSLQAQARDALDQALATSGDLQLRLLRRAADLTFRARGHADRAISLVQGLPDPERVLAQIERTRELIERARGRIEECNNDRAQALLAVATEMQSRAEGAARESRYLAALQLTLSARERALRALRMCNMEESLQEAAERALKQTDDLIARAREVVGDQAPARAAELLARAERIQSEAYSQLKADHAEACLRFTQSARNMAQRAIRLAESRR